MLRALQNVSNPPTLISALVHTPKPPFRKCLLTKWVISASDLDQIMVGLRKQLPPVETEVPRC